MLGTQLSVLGSVVLVLQALLVWFAIPLQLFCNGAIGSVLAAQRTGDAA